MRPKYPKILSSSFYNKISYFDPLFLKLYQYIQFGVKTFWVKCLIIWRRHDVMCTLWSCHESNIIHSLKNADASKKCWSDGMKYSYWCNSYSYFSTLSYKVNVVFTFIFCLDIAIWKWSNFDQILENFWWRHQKLCWQNMVFKCFGN